jgi:hypothetical protein
MEGVAEVAGGIAIHEVVWAEVWAGVGVRVEVEV